MRIPLLWLAFIPLLLCSCPEEEAERAREARADEENHGCRSCPPISISTDDNCPRGYECNPDWKLKTNVLAARGECSCSEVKCADRTATLAVNGEAVGKIKCEDHQWTNRRDSSTTTTSAVCAKGCGVQVCKPSHPKVSKDEYSPLVVKGPSDEENCASAECPNGIAVFSDEGSFKEILHETNLICSSNGKWKIGGAEERYAMCMKEGSFKEMPVAECTRVLNEAYPRQDPPYTCRDGMLQTATSITCPSGSCPLAIGYEKANDEWSVDYFQKVERDNVNKEWLFKYNTIASTAQELKDNFNSDDGIQLGCSDKCSPN